MSLSATQSAPARTGPGPLADAGAPTHPRGPENCVLFLALLLRFSLGILPLLPVLLFTLAARAVRRARRPSLWYFSDSLLEGMDELSPRALRMVRRHLAVIGWLLAGAPNRGMRRPTGIPPARTPGLAPASGARGPPQPA